MKPTSIITARAEMDKTMSRLATAAVMVLASDSINPVNEPENGHGVFGGKVE